MHTGRRGNPWWLLPVTNWLCVLWKKSHHLSYKTNDKTTVEVPQLASNSISLPGLEKSRKADTFEVDIHKCFGGCAAGASFLGILWNISTGGLSCSVAGTQAAKILKVPGAPQCWVPITFQPFSNQTCQHVSFLAIPTASLRWFQQRPALPG